MANSDPRNPRATAIRTKTWQPPNLLPDPNPKEGWTFRWIRTSTYGEADVTNVSVRRREGWEAVRPEEVPELMIAADPTVKENDKGTVQIGGLMLCKMPQEMADARKEYYENLAAQQQTSVDNNLMRESNPRMPMSAPERRTQVTFGRGDRVPGPPKDGEKL